MCTIGSYFTVMDRRLMRQLGVQKSQWEFQSRCWRCSVHVQCLELKIEDIVRYGKNWLLKFKRPYHVVANFGSLIHPDHMIGKDDTSQTAKRQLNADRGQPTDQPADTCGRGTLVRVPGWLACTGVPKRGGDTFMSCW